jgi:hypothetical protein
MSAISRIRVMSGLLLAGAAIGAYAAVVSATATAGSAHHRRIVSERHHDFGGGGGGASHPSVARFDLAGYVIDTDYSLGRNTGNTFQQTYTDSTVQGVPIKGPFVGTTFPPEDYVAMPIGHHELYVAWLDPSNHALVDVFVMNFKTHVVFDYAPGSTSPESSGRVTVVHRGVQPLP